MAVLHHAFRCAVTPSFERTVLDLLAAWEAADRERLSTMAIGRYAALAQRQDIHDAFYLGPDGAASSWLQPQFISPGLAALVMLAANFVPLPSLSGSNDTNHHLLATHLPTLGWQREEIDFLIHGQPIETMLHRYTDSTRHLQQGEFRHTGGWTPPMMTRKLKEKIDLLTLAPPLPAAEAEQAWKRLNESKALDDARAMLAPLNDDDWLVLSTTH